eukprot:scaffold4193_cov109-Skeletonema_dohrnii-CCMP3373.AAC.3
MRSSPVKILANKNNVLPQPQDNGALKWNVFGQPSNEETPLKIKRKYALRENEFLQQKTSISKWVGVDELNDDLGYIYIYIYIEEKVEGERREEATSQLRMIDMQKSKYMYPTPTSTKVQ